MPARYVRHALALLLFYCAVASAQAPQFRLPGNATPERYDVQLAIDPRQAEFKGVVVIGARL